MSSAGQVWSRHKPICVLLTELYHSPLAFYVCMYTLSNKNPSVRRCRSGSDVRYSCHHNSSRFTFPIFAHSWRFSVFHSLQAHRVYTNRRQQYLYNWMVPSRYACVTKFYCKVPSIHNNWIAVVVLQLVHQTTCFGRFIRPSSGLHNNIVN